MPLRLLEFMIPEKETERLHRLLEEQPALGVWLTSSAGGGAMVRILLDAQHVEALSDMLIDNFGGGTDFRMVLMPVEATLPRIEEPEEKQKEKEEESGAKEKPQPRISRDELYEDLDHAGRLTLVYAIMVAVSALVAAVGLIRSDVAIIIGAMVIAPLLGPNVALSLGCTLGDPGLVKRSLIALGVGIAIAAAISIIIGLVLKIDVSSPQIAARTQIGFGSIIVALATGTAGSLAFTTGIPAVLVGVMVAVALLPPLVAGGLLAGAGLWGPAGGALTLLIINITCINLAAVATFLVQKVRPRTWWEEERARKATRIAVATWVIMLAVLVGVIVLKHVGIL